MSSYKARLRSKFEKKFQRNLAKYWTKRLQIVIVLISITVLVYYKLDCSENLNFFSAQSWTKRIEIVIFLIFITVLGYYELL